jgi:hypothetical protein
MAEQERGCTESPRSEQHSGAGPLVRVKNRGDLSTSDLMTAIFKCSLTPSLGKNLTKVGNDAALPIRRCTACGQIHVKGN